MTLNRTQISFLVVVVFLIPLFGGTQNEKEKVTSDKIIEAAHQIMLDAGTCALITIDDKGRPRVRTMDPFPPEKDLTVWFGTNTYSRKVAQIKENNKVTLYYLDKDATGYVMIHGIAQLVDSPKAKKNRFKKKWKDFYPDYPDGYSLIKVTPEWMEIISETRGILGDTKTWTPQKIIFNQ